MCQGRNDNEFTQFEPRRDDKAAQTGQVIFVRVDGFFDQVVGSEPLEHTSHLGAGFSLEERLQGVVGKAANGEFRAHNGCKQVKIVGKKEVETAPCPMAESKERRSALPSMAMTPLQAVEKRSANVTKQI